jgi:hypothetical protein
MGDVMTGAKLNTWPKLAWIPIASVGAIAAVVWFDITDDRCTIITDGSKAVYEHELAHCNGWTHPEWTYAVPPKSYVHAYPGTLTVLQCPDRRHKLGAQADAVFLREPCRGGDELRRRCFVLWASNGKRIAADGIAARSFNGCAQVKR